MRHLYIFLMILIILNSCELINGDIPSKNDLLNFNSPVPLTGLSQYNVTIYDNSKIGDDRVNIANNVDYTLTDSEFSIEMKANKIAQKQRLYTIILESKKSIVVDRIDSILVNFKLDVITDEENPYQLTTESSLIREYLDIKKNDDTKYTTIVTDGVMDENVSKFLLEDNTAFFDVRIRLESAISGIPPSRNNPYVYSEAIYKLKFLLNGFYN